MRKVAYMLLRGLLSVAGGAVLVILVGQLFALTRSTCDTICRPEFAAFYGALGGLVFAFIHERDRLAEEARLAEDEP
ncbi:MAG TPA: hypothetical protein VLQ93_02125 [Myxococcaceae bacterium]|nr:hypothetical protein [Myxococcaceae bacterium]